MLSCFIFFFFLFFRHRQALTFTAYIMGIHYPQLSELNSLRLAFGKPPPSEREALFGSLSEGAVGVADWGSA